MKIIKLFILILILCLPLSVTSQHFVPVWENNGFSHMNIYLIDASIENERLQIGDEIGLFANDLCVGRHLVTEEWNDSIYYSVICSMDDGTGNGFTAGDSIVVKFWDESTDKETLSSNITYLDSSPFWTIDGTYSSGGSAFIEVFGRMERQKNVHLTKGWNIISLPLETHSYDISNIFSELIENDNLQKIMNENGGNYEKIDNVNWYDNIGELKQDRGYRVKVYDSCTIVINGYDILSEKNIVLKSGWNLIGYFGIDTNIVTVFQPLIDSEELIIVMDEAGKTLQDFGILGWINSIGNIKTGKGYAVKVSGDTEITINYEY